MNLTKLQQKAFDSIVKGENIFLTGPAGTGKCLGRDTPILMYNGSQKMSQDIVIGDLIMGDDSSSRKVLDITSGEDDLYRISNSNGDFYVVNSEHILTCKILKTIKWEKKLQAYVVRYGDKNGKIITNQFDNEETAQQYLDRLELPELVDLPIKLYIQKTKSWRYYFQGIYASVEFPDKPTEFDPYLFGLWLGDRTTTIKEIIYHLDKNISTHNLSAKYAFGKFRRIPNNYKFNSRENRLKLLAGLIDIDGYLDRQNYEIIQKDEELAKDICFIARSLGFHTCMTFIGEKYYRILLSGNIYEIPVLIHCKRASRRQQIKDPLCFENKIISIGRGKYHGFTVDGNNRFVLGNFIITHNSHIIQNFKALYGMQKNIAITSTTGVSAIAIGGTTLHSFLGIGLGTGSADDLVVKILKNSKAKQRWT